jgi:MYXO-CTERM domain-containing protein
MSLSYLLLGIFAHVGNIPTIAVFDQPVGVGNVADQSFTFGWEDNDGDMTATFSMYYQPSNLPPNGTVAEVTGTAIPNGQAMPIMDPNDVLVWDTSGVPSGSYYLYSVTTESDGALPPSLGMSHGVVTIRHAGDPLYPAVVVTEPGALSPPVGDAFAVKWEAIGEGPMTATVRGKARDDAGDPAVLATDLPMAEGGGKFTGCYLWNLGAEPNGYYEVQVEVRDSAGRTHASYSISNIVLFRDPQPTDAGVPPSCTVPGTPDAGADAPDAGMSGGDDDGGGGSCGCRVGGARTAGGSSALALLLGLALLARRRRR